VGDYRVLDKTAVTYDERVYDVRSIAEARGIVLTPEGGQSPEERERLETPYLMTLIREQVRVRPGDVVLDYGCGYGRLAREMISEFDCFVVGADTSASMRTMSQLHVKSDRFVPMHPGALEKLGVKVDHVVAVWSLQHCPNLAADLDVLDSQMTSSPRGRLFLVNMLRRAVPTVERGWFDDGLSVTTELSKRFQGVTGGTLDQRHVAPGSPEWTFWATYRR
jgi:SAM-dependent methyltransferase